MADIFEQLNEKLLKTPMQEISGVVEPSSFRAISSAADSSWIITFKFNLWKVGTGDIRTNPVTIRWSKGIDEIEKNKYRDALQNGKTVRLKGHYSEKNRLKRSYVCLVEIVETGFADEELLNKSKEDITFQSERFGLLTLNRKVQAYTTHTNWNEKIVRLVIYPDKDGTPIETIETAETLFNNQEIWDGKVKNLAASQLLSLKNKHWLEADEKEFTKQSFLNRMKLKTIIIYNEENIFDFCFADDGMFDGHDIQVRGSVITGITNAQIIG